MQNTYYDVYSSRTAPDNLFYHFKTTIGNAVFWWRIDPRALQTVIQPNFMQNLNYEIFKILLGYAKFLTNKGFHINWYRGGSVEFVKATIFTGSPDTTGGSVLALPEPTGQSVSHMTLSESLFKRDYFNLHDNTLPHELAHLIANFVAVEINQQAPYPLIEGFADFLSHLDMPCYIPEMYNEKTQRFYPGSWVLNSPISIYELLSYDITHPNLKLSSKEIYTHSRLFIEYLFETFQGNEFLNIFWILFLKKENPKISTQRYQQHFTNWLLSVKRLRCVNNDIRAYPIPLYIEPRFLNSTSNSTSSVSVKDFEKLSSGWGPSANLTSLSDVQVSTAQETSLSTRIGLEGALGATNGLLSVSLQQLNKYLKKKYPKHKKGIGFLLNQLVHPMSFASINLARSYINGTARFLVNEEQSSGSINLIWYFGSSLATTWIIQAVQYGTMCCLQEGNLKKNIKHLFTLLMYLHFLASFFASEDFKENSAAASIGLAVNLLTSILMQLTANCLLPEQSQKNSDNNGNMIEMENLRDNQQANGQHRSKTPFFSSSKNSSRNSFSSKEEPIYTNISETRASYR